jgi:hypothetical protein
VWLKCYRIIYHVIFLFYSFEISNIYQNIDIDPPKPPLQTPPLHNHSSKHTHRCSVSYIELNLCLLVITYSSYNVPKCVWLKFSVWTSVCRSGESVKPIPRKIISGHLNWYLLWVVFRIQDHVYTLKHNLYFLVMALISTQRDCVPVLSVCLVSCGPF